eukprot:comp23637_c0_seq2/m.40315 comp23637_c0_seq2/g.40315  ORF comp23637_c0_seq2/g.40315 comp23637_c0_seq2/m.40315 type:complete len:510 (-) comp23637_c0_seq2:64-1593(-)
MAISELVSPGQLENKYEVRQVLGQGAYSTVRLAKDKETGQMVAIKYVPKEKAFGDMNLETECRLLRTLGRHPNINGFLGLYENKQFYMIVLELLSGGELLDILVARVESGSEPYSEAQVAVIMRQIVSAVDHCHRHNILHRDLKPENILVADTKNLGQVDSLFGAPLKLADFGLAAECPPGEKLIPTCGTPNYMSPERLCRKPYDTASDIWSVGVIMYILLAGTFPFYGETDDEIRWCACNPKEPEYGQEFASVSAPCLQLLKDHLLAKDPRKRPSAAELLRHPWMTGELASTAELKGALQQLKRFNARRKLRASFKALVASKRLSAVMGRLKSEQMVGQLTKPGLTVQKILDLHNEFVALSKGTCHIDTPSFLAKAGSVLDTSQKAELQELTQHLLGPDNLINTRDFCLSLVTKIGASEDETLELCFKLYDTDGNGNIDQTEYATMVRSILLSLGDSFVPNDLWLQQEFESVDTDHSGTISAKEFLQAARSNIKIQTYLKTLSNLMKK